MVLNYKTELEACDNIKFIDTIGQWSSSMKLIKEHGMNLNLNLIFGN